LLVRPSGRTFARLQSNVGLSRAQHETLVAVAEAALPAGRFIPAAGEATVAKVAQFLTQLPATLQRGVGALLRSLGPDVIWEYPVLRYPIFAPHTVRGEDVFLRGQGLILMPSVFLRRSAGLWLQHTSPEAPPVLSYPVGQDFRVIPWSRVEPPSDQPLATLIGPTRAAVLRELDQGSFTTTQLAQRLQISMATASEHAGILRDSGLTASHREGRRVYHALTSLGRALLAGRHGTNHPM